MVDALVGLYLLLVMVGGTATLVGVLVGRRLRARWDQRHPERAAARQRARHQRQLTADWPLLAQTLGLGYRDQWTRQHAYPPARFVLDDQGVTATVAAIAGAGLADYQRRRRLPGGHLGVCERPGHPARPRAGGAARPVP